MSDWSTGSKSKEINLPLGIDLFSLLALVRGILLVNLFASHYFGFCKYNMRRD